MRYWLLSAIGVALAQAPLWEKNVSEKSRLYLLSDGNLLVADRRSGLQALSAAQGEVLWQIPMHSSLSPDSWRPIGESPIWEGGYLQSIPTNPAPEPNLIQLTSNYAVLNTANGLVAFDLQEEGKQWRGVFARALAPEVGAIIIAGYGPKNPEKFITQIAGIIAAYSLSQKRRLWLRTIEHEGTAEMIMSNIVAWEGSIYLLTQRAAYALEARTGEVRWRTPIVKSFNLRAHTPTYLFLDPEGGRLFAFGRERLFAFQLSTGAMLWAKPVEIRRSMVLHLFASTQGLLVFTDDRLPGSQEASTGTNIFNPPLVYLLRYEDGQPIWKKPLQAPGLLRAFFPWEGERLLCAFEREPYLARAETPQELRTEINILDLKEGRFLFPKSYTLKGNLLHVQPVPGGFLVQTSMRLQYISEKGEAGWEAPIRRPFEIPFASSTEEGTLETYCIDQTGQILRWREASGEPEKVGKPLLPLLKDSPQGITYEKGKIWVWGSSSLIGLMPNGEIFCEFSRPPLAQPPVIRILGATVSLAAWAGSVFLTYKYAQEVIRLTTEPSSLVSYLRRSLRASIYGVGAAFSEVLGDIVWKQAVERRRLRAQQMADIAFLVGMQDNHTYLYAVERPTCKVLLQRDLGKPRLLQNPEFEIDPIDQRVFILEGNTLQAFSIE